VINVDLTLIELFEVTGVYCRIPKLLKFDLTRNGKYPLCGGEAEQYSGSNRRQKLTKGGSQSTHSL